MHHKRSLMVQPDNKSSITTIITIIIMTVMIPFICLSVSVNTLCLDEGRDPYIDSRLFTHVEKKGLNQIGRVGA